MLINNIIDFLKKEYHYDNLTTGYYANIAMWEDWWRGTYAPFHKFKEVSYDNRTTHRELYSLKMAKKVCEDWASLLLNEKTKVAIADVKGQKFVDDVFLNNDFWENANALVERAWCTGTGAFVLHVEGMSLSGNNAVSGANTEIRMEFLDAGGIIPLSVQYGKITEVAFVSEILDGGETYVYLELHRLNERLEYVVTNHYFVLEDGGLLPYPLPEGMIESFETHSDIPLFSIVRPNSVNTFRDANGLGASCFAHAIDNLKGVDYCFNNMIRDFSLGGKKVFLNKSMVKYDDNGNLVTPDDVAQQLFLQFDDGLFTPDGNNKMIQEFNPTLRVAENVDGIQAQLDYLSFKVGFGTKHYQFNAGSIVTATQYSGDKQELMQNINKNYVSITGCIQQLIRGILWVGKTIMGNAVNVDSEISVVYDDSYITDKDSRMASMAADVAAGLIRPELYLSEKYGVSENEALKMMPDTQDTIEENPSDRADGGDE